MISIKLDNEMISGLKPIGLSLGQFAIMMTLLERDGIQQVEIGEKIFMPRYATTRNLNKLEELGYIKRHKHETSGRSHCIYLTSKGRKLAPELYSLVKSVNQRLLSPLTNKEINNFVATLSKLHDPKKGV